MRVDDLDGPRVKPGAAAQAVEDLQWLGIHWDHGPIFQTACLDSYRDALSRLAEQGWIYPCRCTRSQIQAASLSAPHAGDLELRYPGLCRPDRLITHSASQLSWRQPSHRAVSWRFRAADEDCVFEDQILGSQNLNVQRHVGDFLVAARNGLASYQLAVVVDDFRQHITDVVRGDDLLSSTPRQLLVWRQLNYGPSPRYWHVPLVVGPDGRRLAKRHGDSRLCAYRERGVAPQRILGLLGFWCGLTQTRVPLSAAEFLSGFNLGRLPRERITMTGADEAWLHE